MSLRKVVLPGGTFHNDKQKITILNVEAYDDGDLKYIKKNNPLSVNIFWK